jgi:hypothetical protein
LFTLELTDARGEKERTKVLLRRIQLHMCSEGELLGVWDSMAGNSIHPEGLEITECCNVRMNIREKEY